MTDDIRALHDRHVWRPFTQAATALPAPVAVAGRGAVIVAEDGREYLDMASSWWVNLHGHARPEIARAIAEQASRLEQVIFADFTHAPAARLAARVAALLPGDLERVFYSDDGSTAVEVALKMALQHFANRGEPQRKRFVAFDGGYHGDTVGAMSVGAASGYFKAWGDLLFPVDVAPFPHTWDGDDPAERERASLDAVERFLSGGDIAAVIVEPLVQGASGMRMCRPAFLRALAERVRAAGALLVFDEVMTGFGRTGAAFACLGAGVTPDLVCLSKGLTGGFLPLSMTVARRFIYESFLGEGVERAFLHGHSYTANPLGCAAGLASLDLLLAPDCQARIARIDEIHRARLDALAAHPKVARMRLCGTIAAFDLKVAEQGYGAAVGQAVKRFCLDRGVLLRPLGGTCYLLPPYCTTDGELERAWDVLGAAVDHV